jgi:hypothetical protein
MWKSAGGYIKNGPHIWVFWICFARIKRPKTVDNWPKTVDKSLNLGKTRSFVLNYGISAPPYMGGGSGSLPKYIYRFWDGENLRIYPSPLHMRPVRKTLIQYPHIYLLGPTHSPQIQVSATLQIHSPHFHRHYYHYDNSYINEIG